VNRDITFFAHMNPFLSIPLLIYERSPPPPPLSRILILRRDDWPLSFVKPHTFEAGRILLCFSPRNSFLFFFIHSRLLVFCVSLSKAVVDRNPTFYSPVDSRRFFLFADCLGSLRQLYSKVAYVAFLLYQNFSL